MVIACSTGFLSYIDSNILSRKKNYFKSIEADNFKLMQNNDHTKSKPQNDNPLKPFKSREI